MNPLTCKLEDSWIDYWRQVIRIAKDGGIVVQPTSGNVFKVNKKKRRMLMLIRGKGEQVEILNQRCLQSLGWRIEYGRWVGQAS
jgi:hypothetical protein